MGKYDGLIQFNAFDGNNRNNYTLHAWPDQITSVVLLGLESGLHTTHQ